MSRIKQSKKQINKLSNERRNDKKKRPPKNNNNNNNKQTNKQKIDEEEAHFCDMVKERENTLVASTKALTANGGTVFVWFFSTRCLD